MFTHSSTISVILKTAMKVRFQQFTTDIFMKLLWDVNFYFPAVGNAQVNLSGKINRITSKAEIIILFFSPELFINSVPLQKMIMMWPSRLSSEYYNVSGIFFTPLRAQPKEIAMFEIFLVCFFNFTFIFNVNSNA